MPSDLIWDIYPQAHDDTMGRIGAYVRHCAAHGIDDTINDDTINAGPATSAARDGLPLRVDSGVAIIPIMGPMMRRAGPVARMFGIAGTDGARLAIQAALADKSVERILLRLDSPGGSVSGLDQLGDTVARADKPVTAIVDGMAASAAYYVASQADRIIAGRTDLVGSIGTRMMLYDFSKAFEAEGIKAVPIDTGKFKSAGAMGTEITDEQKADFQRVVDFYFGDFVAAVARGRGISDADVRKVADGRVFTPDEALQSRLIDGVGTYQQVLNEMRAQRQRRTDTARARLQI